MNDENIKKLRKEIDQLDDQLLDLFIRRSLVVEKIGTFKDRKKQ